MSHFHPPSGSSPAPPRHKSSWGRSGLVGLLVLALAGGAYWFLVARTAPLPPLELAEQALARGEAAMAYQILQRIDRTAPEAAKVPEMLVELALVQGLLDDAAAFVNQLSDNHPQKLRLQLTVAGRAMEQADVARVEALLLPVIRENPYDKNARNLLTRLYQLTLRESDLREQIAAQDRESDDRLDDSVLCLYCIGSRLYGLPDKPMEWLRRALQRDPRNNTVRAALGHLLMQATRRDEARDVLAAGPPAAPDYWRVQIVQIEDWLHAKNSEEAARLLKLLPPAAEKDVRVWIARGRFAELKPDFTAAAAAYQQAMLIDPFGITQVRLLAALQRRKGDVAAAKALFQRADVLNDLSRAVTYCLMTPDDRQESLQVAAQCAEQLQFWRLAYHLSMFLAGKYPNLTEARAKVAQLRSQPAALQPLFQPSR